VRPLALAAVLLAAVASHRPFPVELAAWVTWWDLDAGLASVRAARGSIADVMIFAVALDADGMPRATKPGFDGAAVAREVRAAGARPWLTIVNDVVGGKGTTLKDPEVTGRMLASAELAARHRRALVALAVEWGVVGVDVDFENLRAGDHDAFASFVRELDRELEARGLSLAVTVEPKAADWKALCGAADRLHVMLYNLHHGKTGPGPVATPEWIGEVLGRARDQCPATVVVPALKLGGYDWGSSGVRDATFRPLDRIVREGRGRWRKDRALASPYVVYDRDGETRKAYVEDGESARRKLKLVSKLGFSRAILWGLGKEDPELWPAGQGSQAIETSPPRSR
jgi:spore germination protein YaaH